MPKHSLGSLLCARMRASSSSLASCSPRVGQARAAAARAPRARGRAPRRAAPAAMAAAAGATEAAAALPEAAQEVLERAVPLANRMADAAGEVVLPYFRTPLQVEDKRLTEEMSPGKASLHVGRAGGVARHHRLVLPHENTQHGRMPCPSTPARPRRPREAPPWRARQQQQSCRLSKKLAKEEWKGAHSAVTRTPSSRNCALEY